MRRGTWWSEEREVGGGGVSVDRALWGTEGKPRWLWLWPSSMPRLCGPWARQARKEVICSMLRGLWFGGLQRGASRSQQRQKLKGRYHLCLLPVSRHTGAHAPDVISVPGISPFPECHGNEVTQCVAF